VVDRSSVRQQAATQKVCQILIEEVSGQVFVEFDLPSGRLPWLSGISDCLVVGSAGWVGTRLGVATAQSGVAANSQGTDSLNPTEE
jgi:hypothetical protein